MEAVELVVVVEQEEAVELVVVLATTEAKKRRVRMVVLEVRMLVGGVVSGMEVRMFVGGKNGGWRNSCRATSSDRSTTSPIDTKILLQLWWILQHLLLQVGPKNGMHEMVFYMIITNYQFCQLYISYNQNKINRPVCYLV
ncbi:uncharacterized protein LOC116130392 [Pistacia vera]|uniref:uncharacterized protein LOC116130392 n=1 Tax=Pistacia vera TaxID=55513 RepID=UPI0012636AFC|nr:uncharacterized protein LOC116130392 [Pistacia vera]